jgi:hypothetical protein
MSKMRANYNQNCTCTADGPGCILATNFPDLQRPHEVSDHVSDDSYRRSAVLVPQGRGGKTTFCHIVFRQMIIQYDMDFYIVSCSFVSLSDRSNVNRELYFLPKIWVSLSFKQFVFILHVLSKCCDLSQIHPFPTWCYLLISLIHLS